MRVPAKARIMVVEDDAIIRLDVEHRLRRLGYVVCAISADADSAMVMALQSQPDLVLMDIGLQNGEDGVTAALRINAQMDVPVVFLTAHADAQTLERAMTAQPYGYVIKPFHDRDLAVTLDMALTKHAMERRLVEKERLLSTTLGSLCDAVITTDVDGVVQYLNPAAQWLSGNDSFQAIGRRLEELLQLYDSAGRPITQEIMSSVSSDSCKGERSALPRCMKLSLACGRDVPVSLTISPVGGKQNALTGVVYVLRDLTAQQQAQCAVDESIVKLKGVLTQTVNALAATSEVRDPYTAGHQQRMAQLACAIASSLGYDANRLEGLRVAATLHDLGKISVPAEILSKPTRLTAMEMGIVKSHSEVAYDILKDISFPWPVATAVLQHHERLDGSGYPKGLKGEEILHEARILAVADVVEAMSSHRPYRPALGIHAALEEITKQRGLLYDAEVVGVCLWLFKHQEFRFNTVV